MIHYLNKLMRNYLQNENSVNNDEMEKYFMASNSILWNRTYGSERSKNKCSKLNNVLDYFSVKGMIIGHTPQDNIKSDCDNKLWKVDVGISDAFEMNNHIQVLEIIDDGKEMNVLKI